MKILLDECMPVGFRHLLQGHEAHSTRWAGFSGKKNGELLRLAERAGYDAFLTVDQGIQYQHNIAGIAIAIVVMRAVTNDIEKLGPLARRVLRALAQIRPGEVITVG